MQDIEEIYKKHAKTIYKYVFCLCHDNQTAEEITQETFAIAIKEIKKFKGNCKISVWLCQIAKHLWYNECKKRKNREKYKEQFEEFKNTEDEYIEKEEKEELYKRIERLEDPLKEIMYLRIIGELSFKEIGEIFRKSENWARVSFFRGKQKFKEGD